MLHPLFRTNIIISGWLTLNMETSCISESSVSLIIKQSTLYNKQENSESSENR
jgi:hypothetical protein